MFDEKNVVPAPKVDPYLLFVGVGNEFNSWRRQYDYPRIISFIRRKLPEFETWMQVQNVSDAILIEHSPSTFLKEGKTIHLYQVLCNSSNREELIRKESYKKGDIIFHEKTVENRHDIEPYPTWYIKTTKKQLPSDMFVNLRIGSRCFFMGELELIDLGDIRISNRPILGGRLMDFVDIDNLSLFNCMNNGRINLHFSSSVNVTIDGGLVFVDAYKTSFYQVGHSIQNLKLINGYYQDWSFTECGLSLTASNAILVLWNYSGWDFEATIGNTDIIDCKFRSSKIIFPIGYERARNFYARVKRLYSQIGKKKEASNYYYLEKTFERKSYLHPRTKYKIRQTPLTKADKAAFNLRCFLRYGYLWFLNVLWGYGERPARVFIISIITILLFSILYCYSPSASSQTYHDLGNSIYYSVVTFTTLGYGDISQHNKFLKLLSGFEALLGLSFWGILIAGFTSNAKDY